MNHFVLSASLASLCSFLAALGIWRSSPSSSSSRLLGLYWFSIAFWAFFVGTQFFTIEVLSEFWWGWLLHLGCTFIPVLLFHSVIVFTRQATPKLHRVLRISYGITVLFNLLNLWTTSFTSGTAVRDAYSYPKPSFLYPLYFLLFVTLVTWSTALMIQYLTASPSEQKKGLVLLLLTHILAYVGGMDNFLIMVDIRFLPLYPFGLYLIPPYALATVYAVHQGNVIRDRSVPI